MPETVADQVREEYARFEAALPDLIEEHRGKWVIFKNGNVYGFFDDEDSAYVEGLKKFGRDGGHVVAQVTEPVDVPITSAALFA